MRFGAFDLLLAISKTLDEQKCTEFNLLTVSTL